MTLRVAIRHRLGTFGLDVAFESRGRLTAIFGASGSGKTSLIYVIAGLVRPDHGTVTLDGDTLTDTGRGLVLAAHRRRIGYVFQDARLFPHLSVAQNLAYGRWFAPRRGRYTETSQVVGLLGIGHLLDRRPAGLSGGERQRVAIGRALLSAPRLLLMDEPLAALDQPRKDEILPYIERLRDEFHIPIVYVSHSVAEVARLATGIVVLAEGRVAAEGPAADILQRLDLVPAEERDEAGVVLEMTVAAHDARYDMTVLRSPAGEAHVPGRAGAVGARARVRIRARDVMIATAAPAELSALNVFAGELAALTPSDRASVVARIDCGGSAIMARITRQSADRLGLAPGQRVYAVVKAVSVSSSGAAAAP